MNAPFARWEDTLSTKLKITRQLHVLACCLSQKNSKKEKEKKTKITRSFLSGSSAESSNRELLGEPYNAGVSLFTCALPPSAQTPQSLMALPYLPVFEHGFGPLWDLCK